MIKPAAASYTASPSSDTSSRRGTKLAVIQEDPHGEDQRNLVSRSLPEVNQTGGNTSGDAGVFVTISQALPPRQLLTQTNYNLAAEDNSNNANKDSQLIVQAEPSLVKSITDNASSLTDANGDVMERELNLTEAER